MYYLCLLTISLAISSALSTTAPPQKQDSTQVLLTGEEQWNFEPDNASLVPLQPVRPASHVLALPVSWLLFY